MGLFKRARKFSGAASQDLLEHGIPRRAGIIGLKNTNVVTGVSRDPVIEFTLMVSDKGRTYNVTHRQVAPQIVAARVKVGGIVAVRVNADDETDLVIDWERDPEAPVDPGPAPGTRTEAELLDTVAELDETSLERVAAASEAAWDPATKAPARVDVLTAVADRDVGELTLMRLRIRVTPDDGTGAFDTDFHSLMSARVRALAVPGASLRGTFDPATRAADIDFPPAG